MKKLKQWVTVFATVILVLLLIPQKTLLVSAAQGNIASGTSNNVTWVIDANGKLTVSGTGDFYDSYSSPPWYDFATSIKSAEINVTGMTHAKDFFRDCRNLKKVDLSGFDTSNVTSMDGMFASCTTLTDLDLSSFNTLNVTDMGSMFASCTTLTSLNLSSFNTSNVTDMNRMFYECRKLTNLNLSNFDTSNVTDMSSMFSTCINLTDLNLSSFNTSNVTDMDGVFYECRKLTNLNLSNFDTSNVTDMSSMFYNCPNLTQLDLSSFDTSNVTDMSRMFEGCSSLIQLNLSSFDTSNVTDMSRMFEDCLSLTQLDLSNFDASNVTNMGSPFYGCSNLTNIHTPYNLKVSANLPEDYQLHSKWYLPDGTAITELPKNLSHSVMITRKSLDNNGNNSDNSDDNNNSNGNTDDSTNGDNNGSTGGNNNDFTGGNNNGSNNDNSGDSNNNDQNSSSSGILEGTGNNTDTSIYGLRKLAINPTTFNTMYLTWNAVPGAKSYEIFYSTSADSGYKRLTNTKKTSYKFSKAKCGVTYYFQMRVCVKGAKSEFGPISYSRTDLTGAPTLQVKKTTYNSVSLKWNKVPGAKKYEIFCMDSINKKWESIGIKGGTSFTHKKLVTGATYYYQIRPVRDSFYGSYSNGVSTSTVLSDVAKLKVKATSTDQMRLTWKKVKGATQYVILRSNKINGTYETIGHSGKTSYTDTGLQSGTTYFYKVYAVSGPYRTKETAAVGQMTKIPKVKK